MLNKKFIIGLIIALIALIVVGFIALNFVPTGDIVNLNVNKENITDNATLNLTNESIDSVLNVTDLNDTDVNDTNADDKDKNSSDIDPGDVLHKQTFTVSENETGQNQGMEPGTYVMYYTTNDGPIKIKKVA